MRFLTQWMLIGSGMLHWGIAALATGSPVIEVGHTMDAEDIGTRLLYLRDADHAIGEKDILSGNLDHRFRRPSQKELNQGIDQSTFWIRLQLHNSGDKTVERLLAHQYTSTAYLTLYHPDQTGRWISRTIGHRVDATKREIYNRKLTFPVNLPPGDSVIYLKLRTYGGAQFLMRLWSPRLFRISKEMETALLGLFFGGFLIMALYNLFLYFSSGEKTQLYYSLYLLSLIGAESFLTGLGMLYCWGEMDYMGNNVAVACINVAGLMALVFTASFLETRENMPRAHYLLWIPGILAFIAITEVLWLDYSVGVRLSTIVIAVESLIIIALGIRLCLRKYRPALYFTAAWIMLLTLNMANALMHSGILPGSFLTNWGHLIGLILEVVLLSFAIGDKLNLIKEGRAREKLLRLKMEHSLNEARAVQETLLPRSSKVPGIGIEAYYQSADQTGGDWYDYFHDEAGQRLYFFVGDVTGHGISAALVTGLASGAIRTGLGMILTRKEQLSPLESLSVLAGSVNDTFISVGDSNHFMTMVFLSIDLTTGEVTYLNAGHPGIIIAGSAGAKEVLRGGSLLGFEEETDFGTLTLTMDPGDVIFVYTDGLLENKGPDGRTYRIKQLKSLLKRSHGQPLSEITHEILTAGRKIWNDHPAGDDTTFISLRWRPEELKKARSA